MQYLRKVAGHRTVPVEMGGSYTSDGWRQQLMTLSKFIERHIEKAKRDQGAPSGSGDADGSNGATGPAAAYLAQHELLEQIPALRRDIL
ncbi:unnamed protein product, partial [Phaeothamnion confervicola]